VEINCYVPITVRLTGVPTDDQLAALGRALTRVVAGRLAEAQRVLAQRHGRHPGWRPGGTVTILDGPASGATARFDDTDDVRFLPASLPGEPSVPPPGTAPPPSTVDEPTGTRPAQHLDPAMARRQEQRSRAATQGRVPDAPAGGAPDPFGPTGGAPNPFGDALREALADALRNPPPPPQEPILPGDRHQQLDTVPEVDVVAWWRLPQTLRDLAERLVRWQLTRSRPDTTRDAGYYLDVFRVEFMTSLTYILQHRKTRRYKGVAVTVRELRLAELRAAETNLATPPPPDRFGAQNRALWAMGAVIETEGVRRAAHDQWQQDIAHAADQFLVLARNQTDFITIVMHATPIRIYGLPEWLEGTVPASAHRDLVEQDPHSPGYSPTVIRFLTAVRHEYGPHVRAANYTDHEKSNMYVGDITGIGKYSFDVDLPAPVNDDGFYDHAEAVRFFLALERASVATETAWVAFYNDFAVAREVNEQIGKARVGFSGAGSPYGAGPGDEGSIHHGPRPYILHIHVNVMPQLLARQFFANRGVAELPSIDLGGTPE
jgi:hypothetical protein